MDLLHRPSQRRGPRRGRVGRAAVFGPFGDDGRRNDAGAEGVRAESPAPRVALGRCAGACQRRFGGAAAPSITLSFDLLCGRRRARGRGRRVALSAMGAVLRQLGSQRCHRLCVHRHGGRFRVEGAPRYAAGSRCGHRAGAASDRLGGPRAPRRCPPRARRARAAHVPRGESHGDSLEDSLRRGRLQLCHWGREGCPRAIRPRALRGAHRCAPRRRDRSCCSHAVVGARARAAH